LSFDQFAAVIQITSSSGCTYTEHVAFTVDDRLLRSLAAGYVPGKPGIWLYKFIGKSGPDFTDGLSNAEISGFLAKVDLYTEAHHLAAGTRSKPEFGVILVPLPPSADQPLRTGLLIVQVKPGSVAERSGVQVGDVVTEFAGTAVKQNVDLQDKVALVSPGASVPMKLIRGATDLTVTAQF
jgi:membrane-associated protease RseP (regulator of RpoE activity)